MKRRIRFCTVLVAIAVWLFVLATAAISYLRPAGAAGLTYAQVNAGGATLFEKSGDTYRSVTTLPETYFVCLTGEMADGYLPVGYLDIDGYVLATAVTVVDYEPVYKYAASAALALVSDGHTVNLRSRPDHTADNVALRLPQTATLHYYGTATGTAQVAVLGETWYYVRYESGGSTYRGYVYMLYADPAPIPANVIERVVPPAPADEKETVDPHEDPFRPGSAVSIIVIVCMSIPAAAALILLYRNESKKTKRPLNAE